MPDPPKLPKINLPVEVDDLKSPESSEKDKAPLRAKSKLKVAPQKSPKHKPVKIKVPPKAGFKELSTPRFAYEELSKKRL